MTPIAQIHFWPIALDRAAALMAEMLHTGLAYGQPLEPDRVDEATRLAQDIVAYFGARRSLPARCLAWWARRAFCFIVTPLSAGTGPPRAWCAATGSAEAGTIHGQTILEWGVARAVLPPQQA
jgi:hypothetical protein